MREQTARALIVGAKKCLEYEKAPHSWLKKKHLNKFRPGVPVHVSGVPVHIRYCPLLSKLYRYTFRVYRYTLATAYFRASCTGTHLGCTGTLFPN